MVSRSAKVSSTPGTRSVSRTPRAAGSAGAGLAEVRRGATRTPPRRPATRLTWYDAASTDGGLAGISCTVPDVAQEAAFREEFVGASWQERGPDAACGTIPSPRSRGECAFVIARGEDAPGHATNDVGFRP